LTPATARAAYRIVQESLTNAHRHGTKARAVLRVTYEPEALSIEVVNEVAPPGSGSGRAGHEIVGMRERVAAAGGTIEIGPTPSSSFRVHATLPVAGEGR
jgi:signal transduction histidine kinase